MLHKLKELSKDSAIYGLGDVAVSIVNFLLLPLYVRYLTDVDYGILAQLGAVEVLTKIVARWGLDGSFMRFFYDSPEREDRQRLASSIFFFLLFSNGVLLLASMLGSRWLASALYSEEGTTALRLVLLNTLVMSFTFLPFHVLRMEKRSIEYSLLTLARSVVTVVLRLVLIVGFGQGVLGVVLADVIVTAILMLVLARRFVPLIRPVFSADILRQSLRFGLPRLPHAAAQQVIAVADKLILPMFRSLGELGVYSMGVSFGLTLKLFLSAFESAWAPFYYATAREPGAAEVFRTVTTYGVAALVFLAAALSATARDLLDLMTKGRFLDSAPVVAWTSLAVLFQGVYLLTSIGLNLTKRTEYLPGRDDCRRDRERRAELRADPALRHDGGGVGERGRLCPADGHRLQILPALLPGALRIQPAGPDNHRRRRRVPRRAAPSRHAGAGCSRAAAGDRGRRVWRPPVDERVLQRGRARHAGQGAAPGVGPDHAADAVAGLHRTGG